MGPCISSKSLHRVSARVLVALLLPLLGCESPRFMPHLAEVQPPLEQDDGVKVPDGPTEEAAAPVVSTQEATDTGISEAQASMLAIDREESLSAEDMLKLMAESEREAAIVKGLDTQPVDQGMPFTRDGRLSLDAAGVKVESTGPVRDLVALLVPLSGRGAQLGQAMLNAAQMSLFENFDSNTTLIIKDTGGTPRGAAEAASEALDEGAQLLVGPLFSESVNAAAPVARARGVPMIGFSNDRSVAGQGVYVFGFTPGQQVRRIISFAEASGLRRIVTLVPDSAYGYAVASALEESIAGSRVSIAKIEYFATDGSDSMDVVRRIATLDKSLTSSDERALDCVLIAAGGRQLRSLANLFPYFDVETRDVRLLGTELWHYDTILGEPALHGGWYAAPPPGTWVNFHQKYEASFDSPPPYRAALAYDAVSLAGKLIETEQINEGRPVASRALSTIEEFVGIQGMFRFNSDGVAERGLAIYEVSEGGVEIVDPPRLDSGDGRM